MKIALSTIVNASQLYPQIKSQILPPLTAYKLAKLFRNFAESEDFYRNELQKIIDKYCMRDNEGNPVHGETEDSIRILPQYISTANLQINELMKLEVDAPDITLTFDELSDLKLTIEQFNMLLPFIHEAETT